MTFNFDKKCKKFVIPIAESSDILRTNQQTGQSTALRSIALLFIVLL